MPLALDPNQTVDFWFDSDADKPADARPTLHLRFLTCRQLRKLQALRKQASEEQDNDRCDALVNEALGLILAGWRNLPVPFAAAAVDDVLTLAEKWAVLNDGPSRVMVSESDLKNSGWRRASGGGSSAAGAGTDGASASPPSPNPPSSAPSAPPAAGT